MKYSEFFKMLETANEFKTLIGETVKTKVNIICDGETVGIAYTYEQFEKVLDDVFHPDTKNRILCAELQTTLSTREFRFFYWFDDEPKNIRLFVE